MIFPSLRMRLKGSFREHLGRINNDFKTRFKEHRRDFTYTEGNSTFADNLVQKGHDIKKLPSCTQKKKKNE